MQATNDGVDASPPPHAATEDGDGFHNPQQPPVVDRSVGAFVANVTVGGLDKANAALAWVLRLD